MAAKAEPKKTPQQIADEWFNANFYNQAIDTPTFNLLLGAKADLV